MSLPETELVLYLTFPITLDSNGGGQVQCGPAQAFTRWKLTRYSVTSTQPTAGQTVFTLYRGDPNRKQVVDFTGQGWGDTSDGNDVNLKPGDYVTGVWVGGVAASVATLTIEGSIFVAGKRGY